MHKRKQKPSEIPTDEQGGKKYTLFREKKSRNEVNAKRTKTEYFWSHINKLQPKSCHLSHSLDHKQNVPKLPLDSCSILKDLLDHCHEVSNSCCL